MKRWNMRVDMMLCLAVAALLWTGCGGDGSPKTSGDAEEEPDQRFLGSRIVITENGLTGAIVEAESVTVDIDANHTAIDGGMKIDFFDSDGIHTSTLTARKGEVWGLYESVDSLKATGDIVIVSADKMKRMETPSSLWWVSEGRMVYADGLVKLTTEDAVEQGINFVAKDDLSEYRMDNVSGRFEGTDMDVPGRRKQ